MAERESKVEEERAFRKSALELVSRGLAVQFGNAFIITPPTDLDALRERQESYLQLKQEYNKSFNEVREKYLAELDKYYRSLDDRYYHR